MFPIKVELKNKKILVIREPKQNEAEKIVEYFNQVSAETNFLARGAGEVQENSLHLKRKFKDYKDKLNKIYLVGIIDNNIASIITFDGLDKPRKEHFGLAGLTVLKKYWGIGIAKAMFKALIKWSKQTGVVKKINLRVQVRNKKAILLYEKLGFIKEGTIRKYFRINNRFYDAYMMGKFIT